MGERPQCSGPVTGWSPQASWQAGMGPSLSQGGAVPGGWGRATLISTPWRAEVAEDRAGELRFCRRCSGGEGRAWGTWREEMTLAPGPLQDGT